LARKFSNPAEREILSIQNLWSLPFPGVYCYNVKISAFLHTFSVAAMMLPKIRVPSDFSVKKCTVIKFYLVSVSVPSMYHHTSKRMCRNDDTGTSFVRSTGTPVAFNSSVAHEWEQNKKP
jgi:hypothetical protein